jgi:hypothetical protein
MHPIDLVAHQTKSPEIPFPCLGFVWLGYGYEKSYYGLWAVKKVVVAVRYQKTKNCLVETTKNAKSSSIYIFTIPSESH